MHVRNASYPLVEIICNDFFVLVQRTDFYLVAKTFLIIINRFFLWIEIHFIVHGNTWPVKFGARLLPTKKIASSETRALHRHDKSENAENLLMGQMTFKWWDKTNRRLSKRSKQWDRNQYKTRYFADWDKTSNIATMKKIVFLISQVSKIN